MELRFALQAIVNAIGQLPKIVKIAINNGLIRNDPLISYEYITPSLVPKSLTIGELKKLIKARLSRPNLYSIRDMFLSLSFNVNP